MKKLVTISVFIAMTIFILGQDKNNVRPFITGYKENDTIRLDDFLKIKEISLSNKSKVESFVLVYTDNGYDFMMKGISNTLNEEMKARLLKFKNRNLKYLKISLKAVAYRTPQNEELKTGPVKYVLRIK
jgi:hypothetical protein